MGVHYMAHRINLANLDFMVNKTKGLFLLCTTIFSRVLKGIWNL